jgi:hypothetical protein
MMKSTKKKQLATSLLLFGCMMSFFSFTTKAQGSATSTLKIIMGLGGAGCCIAGLVLQIQGNKSNPPEDK